MDRHDSRSGNDAEELKNDSVNKAGSKDGKRSGSGGCAWPLRRSGLQTMA